MVVQDIFNCWSGRTSAGEYSLWVWAAEQRGVVASQDRDDAHQRGIPISFPASKRDDGLGGPRVLNRVDSPQWAGFIDLCMTVQPRMKPNCFFVPS